MLKEVKANIARHFFKESFGILVGIKVKLGALCFTSAMDCRTPELHIMQPLMLYITFCTAFTPGSCEIGNPRANGPICICRCMCK